MAGRFGLNRAHFLTSKAAGLMVLVLASSAAFAVESPTGAGAISPPFVQHQVTTDQTVDMVCRANGGSLGGNEEEDQQLNDSVTAPDVVQPGETYTIKINPRLSIFPASSAAPIGTATVNYVYDNVSSYTLPASLHVNSVTMAPSDGNIAANPDAGYYVAKANVPASAWATRRRRSTRPPQLPAADLLAIPGTAPSVLLDTSTNTVRYGLLGNSGSKIFPGGSAVQAPAIYHQRDRAHDRGRRHGAQHGLRRYPSGRQLHRLAARQLHRAVHVHRQHEHAAVERHRAGSTLRSSRSSTPPTSSR